MTHSRTRRPCAEPSVRNAARGFFRALPVFEEDGRPTHLEPPGTALQHRALLRQPASPQHQAMACRQIPDRPLRRSDSRAPCRSPSCRSARESVCAADLAPALEASSPEARPSPTSSSRRPRTASERCVVTLGRRRLPARRSAGRRIVGTGREHGHFTRREPLLTRARRRTPRRISQVARTASAEPSLLMMPCT